MSNKPLELSLSKTAAYSFDFLVFIGRFQPFHNGHFHVLQTALTQAEHVIVLVGSSYQARDSRNPWTFAEREAQILSALSAEQGERLIILPLLDDLYNDQNWVSRVQQSVHGVTCRFPPKIGRQTPRIGLIGYSKDESSYYLSLFPQWESMNVAAQDNLSSTPIREQFFLHDQISTDLPDAVQHYLDNFRQTTTHQNIVKEWQFIHDYLSGWENTPYPPIFVTVDAVVIQAGHVLLVERKARPGEGLLALPGGFIRPQEKLKDAVIRELREETRIKIPAPVLMGSIIREQVFDAPHRSARGRTITHAYLIELKPDRAGLAKVKGNDDARQALWMPLGELNPAVLFEDHFHIIKAMVG